MISARSCFDAPTDFQIYTETLTNSIRPNTRELNIIFAGDSRQYPLLTTCLSGNTSEGRAPGRTGYAHRTLN